MRKCAVGGQAVMEGVMMKSDKGIAMAVRRADGKIVASYKNQVSKAQKGTFWGLPVIRGVVALVESLTTGMSTTMDSAKMYGEDAFADEEPTKFEKWLAKTFGKSVEKIAITVALVLGVCCRAFCASSAVDFVDDFRADKEPLAFARRGCFARGNLYRLSFRLFLHKRHEEAFYVSRCGA